MISTKYFDELHEQSSRKTYYIMLRSLGFSISEIEGFRKGFVSSIKINKKPTGARRIKE